MKTFRRPSWKIRRRIIFTTLLFCMGMVFYLAVFAESSSLRENVAMSLTALAGAVIGSYVFGAVWDDSNFMKTGSEHDISGIDQQNY